MKKFFVAALLVTGSTVFAQRGVLDDNKIIPLNDIATSTMSFRVNYPGIGEILRNGQLINTYNTSDCLAAMSSATPFTEKLAAELIDSLNLDDGLINPVRLQAQIIQGTPVFFIANLSFYVTDLKVSSVSGKPIQDVIREIFGDLAAAGVRLEYSRGCRILGGTFFSAKAAAVH